MADKWEDLGMGERHDIAVDFPGKEILERLDKRQGHWSGKGRAGVSFGSGENIPLKGLHFKGNGAFGDVHKQTLCFDDQSVVVATKGIRFGGKPEKVAKEISILKNLQHRHVIAFIGSYTIKPTTTIIMYPCATCDLKKLLGALNRAAQHNDQRDEAAQLLAELGWLTPSKKGNDSDLTYEWEPASVYSHLRRICGCIASGLLYLHQKSIRHRDIKPENILVDRNGVYITDFNISANYADRNSSRTSGPYAGTFDYSAPECFHNKERGRLSDVYSLGLVFMEIFAYITGQPIDLISEYQVAEPGPPTKESVMRNAGLKVMLAMRIFHDSGKENHGIRDLISRMISENEHDRPNTFELVSELWAISPNGQFFCESCQQHQRCFGYKGLVNQYESLQKRYNEMQKELASVSLKASQSKVEATPASRGRPTPSPSRSAPETPPRQTLSKSTIILRNANGDRLDLATLSFARNLRSLNDDGINRLRSIQKLGLCSERYLKGRCKNENDGCNYKHNEPIDKRGLEMLDYIVRGSSPCQKGKGCTDPKCYYGHLCPQGPSKDAHQCTFDTEMHVSDTVPSLDASVNA